jgi:hypothetical protein
METQYCKNVSIYKKREAGFNHERGRDSDSLGT